MKKNILFLLCVALGTFAIQVQAQFTVNFQYTNSAGGGVGVPALYTGTGVPGVGTGTFWNTVPGPASSLSLNVGDPHSTSRSSFADNGITDTKIKWTLTTKGNYNRNPIVGLSLLNSYAVCKISSGSIPFYFTNVPSGTYNVVLFSLGGANTGSGTSFTINGLTLTNKEPGNKSSAFIMYTNFVVFSNVVVTTEGAINGTWQSSSSANTIDAHFNGVQLQRVSAITAYAFQPSVAPSNSVAGGTQVTLTANAVGVAPVLYQWQTDGGGSTFTNISGATNNPYQMDTTGLLGTNDFLVIVSDASGSSTSAPIALTISSVAPPTFLPNPPAATPGTTAFVGGQVTLTMTVSGTQPITEQWQVDKGFGATNIVNATNLTLILTNLQFSDAGSYALYATNSVGSSNSLPVVLTILAAPAAPDAGSFASAVLTNSPIDYWRLNDPAGLPVIYDWSGTHIGANNSITLGVPGPQAPTYPGFSSTNTAGSFDGSVSAMTTGASLLNGLTKFTLAGWFNPSGPNPVNTSGLFGQNGVAEVGYFDTSGVTVWMPTTSSNSWTILHSGPTGFTQGQWYFTALVADGTNVTMYVNGQQRAQAVNAGAPKGTSTYGFNIGGGPIFDANNDTFNGTIGDVALFNKALTIDQIQNLYIAGVGTLAPSIVTPPASLELLEGHTATFTVGAFGFPLSYQWQAGPVGGPYTNLNNGGNISGATSATLNLADVSPSQAGEYLVTISNSISSITSDPATLTVDLKPAGQWVVNFDFDTTAGGITGTYSGLGVLGTGTYWNQILGPNSSVAGNYTSGSGFTDNVSDDTGISLSLTTSGNWSSPLGNNLLDDYALALGGSKPFTFKNVFDGVYNVVLFGVDGAYTNRGTTFTINGVTKSTTNATETSFVEGDNYVIIRNVVANNGIITGTWLPNPVLIGGTNNTEGDFCGAQLQYVGDTLAPSITTQPNSSTVLEMRTANFTVVANGTPLNYQWQSGPVGGPFSNLNNGGNISGVNTSTLTVSNVTAESPVQYRVQITNTADSVTSIPATLTVVPQTQLWVVNYDFDTTEGGVAGTYSGPGVVGSGTYWNSIPGPNFWSQSTYTGAGGLTDDGAINTGISCSVAMDGNWCYPPSSPNNVLLDDYTEALNGVARQFTFNNIYNGVYNLVLFGINGGYLQSGTIFTVNGVSKSTVNTTDTSFVQGDNYVIFRNLVVTNGVLGGTYGANPILVNGVTNVQGNFCGVQLQYVGQSIVPLAPPTLGLQTTNGLLQLQWSQGGTLLESTNVTGPWTTNAAATSPYILNPTLGQKFFRVFLQD